MRKCQDLNLCLKFRSFIDVDMNFFLLLFSFLFLFSSCNSGLPEQSPTIEDQLAAESTTWTKKIRSPGSINFGQNDGLKILLTGDATLGISDYVGPPSSNQIETRDSLSFGTYRVFAKAASCANPTLEEVITGIFTYSSGGDTNANGITDNNEIDIEIACSMPDTLFLTIWTDYSDDSHFQKVTRKINLNTGEYYQTEPGKEGEYGTKTAGIVTGLDGHNIDLTKNFYELGFDWHSDSVRYFININGSDITLWDYQDKTHIPQSPSKFMINVWHADENWKSASDADYPSEDAIVEVDWFKYWANQ